MLKKVADQSVEATIIKQYSFEIENLFFYLIHFLLTFS